MSPGRGLDWFNALVSSVQTGFGPFVAVYLASEAWTQREIGTALSLGTLAGMLSQVPAGAVVDATPRKRLAALAACAAVAASALILAVWPARLPVLAAEVLHGFASCMLGPAIAAISLRLVGHEGLGGRLGRNARWAAAGSGVAAAVMGAVGTYVDEAAVFWLTALLMLPALLALRAVRQADAAPAVLAPRAEPPWRMLRDPRLLAFLASTVLFQLGNAAVLPLLGGAITRSSGSRASLVIAACIILPQALMALLAPSVGVLADRWGRRPVLLLAIGVMPVRLLLLTLVLGHPWLIVLVQLLDGVSAAGLGVLVPLVAADLTRGSNRFNLCMGLIGLAVGLGATVSTTLAGFVATAQGTGAALLVLAGAGGMAVGASLLLRETRDGEAARR